MIQIPQSPGYDKRPITDKPQCVVCNRLVDPKKAKWIHMWSGLYAVTEEEWKKLIATKGDSAESGFWPVGAECLRRYPELKPYAQKTMGAT